VSSARSSSCHIREHARAPSCSSRTSLMEMSRITNHYSESAVLSEASVHQRQQAPRSRPRSARESRPSASGAASSAVRTISTTGPPAFPIPSQSCAQNIEVLQMPEGHLAPTAPSHPRGRAGSGRPPPCGVQRMDGEAITKQRLLRPTSAKATKHKRVAECYDKPSVYEDYEPSVGDECEDLDVETGEVDGLFSTPPNFEEAPATRPHEMKNLPEHEQEQKAEDVAAIHGAVAPPSGPLSKGLIVDADSWTAAMHGGFHKPAAPNPPATEPRASTPPRRPRSQQSSL
jgi:hypothetical protein